MHALRQDILPPSGVEYATSLKLTPSTLADQVLPTPPGSSARHELAARALCNLVVARTSLLRIFEIRQELVPFPSHDGDEKDKMTEVRKGTEAVEGEVEMDEQGDGFVNMGSAKVIQNINVTFTTSAMSMSVSISECIMLMEILVVPAKWQPASDRDPILFCAGAPLAWHRHRPGKH